MDYKCKIMINRINLILRAKNITARQFAEEIGIQPSGMSHILGGRNNPSLEFISKVLRRYPEIDANWLLLGKGEMYVSAQMPSHLEVQREEPVPAEPSLFEEEPVEPLKVAEPVKQPMYQQEAIEEEGRLYTPSYMASAPEAAPAASSETQLVSERRLERILFIYSDNTFVELHPQQ